MKIGVLVKTVHYLYAQTGTDIAKNFICENDYVRLVNPLDEVAIEYALRLGKTQPEATVTIVGYGEEAQQYSCRHGLAMGADRAMVLQAAAANLLNPYLACQLLAAACQPENFDVILCGADSLDSGNRLEAQFLAETLKMGHLTNIVALQIGTNSKTLAVERLIEGGSRQLMECDTPVLLTIARSNITPRYPTLAGSLRAEECTVETASGGSLAADQELAKVMLLRGLIRPTPGRQNGTAALAKRAAEERVLFMIEGDTSAAQGGEQVQAGSPEMYQKLGVILSHTGITAGERR